jgi:hypothetical protein
LLLPVGAVLVISTIISLRPTVGPVCLSFLIGVPLVLWGLGRLLWLFLFRDALRGLIMMVVVWPLMALAMVAGDYVHFALCAPYYVWAVADIPPGQPRHREFHWGTVGVVGGPETDKTLIYDPAKARTVRSRCDPMPDWTPGPLLCTSPLVGGFYMISLR